MRRYLPTVWPGPGAAAIALLLITAAAAGPSPAVPTTRADVPGVVSATIRDQTELAVTVYNSDIALVRDVRQVTLPSGTLDLRFLDIAATVNPATVHFRSLSEPSRLGILEQNYQFDLLDPQRLLRKYIGRDVTLVRTRMDNGTSRTEEVTARLLAFNESPVWQIGDEIVTGLHAEQYRFPEIPENLHSRPTLVWKVDNTGQRQHRIETSYLARSMSWVADYVLTVGRDDAAADLDGWVTVTNTSGTSYKNAKLQLVAGDLHRVEHDQVGDARMQAKVAREMAAAAPAFAREAFSEYHLYALNRKTTLLENETKQIALLGGTGVSVKKLFIVNGQNFYYRNRHAPGSPIKDQVRVFYKFRNSEQAGLGMPMPAGTVRVYQADSKGGLQFAGEDRIGHTPKDEDLTLQIGTAFDVVCERKQTDWEKVADGVYEMGFEITLRNHKATAIAVQINEPIAGDWRMLTSTHPHQKTDAWAAQFEVPVGPGAESVLRYRVRVRW
jgi:hypothetical protein